MKQHITEKQLNELSKKQKNKLLKYQISKDGWTGVMTYTYGHPKGKFIKRELTWIMNIGEMIEFLDENGQETIPIDTSERNIIGANNWFIVWDSGELCDSLWEAVKERL